MKMVLRLVLLAALIAAGVWLWTILFPSPEKIIRQRLAQAASEVSFKSGENPVVSAARAETFAGFFSTNVEVNISLPEHGRHNFVGRDEITQTAMARALGAQQFEGGISRHEHHGRPGQISPPWPMSSCRCRPPATRISTCRK